MSSKFGPWMSMGCMPTYKYPKHPTYYVLTSYLLLLLTLDGGLLNWYQKNTLVIA